jgi:hypothetical protein
VLALAAAAYVTQAYVADSPYWFHLTHRPLARALWAAVSLADWSQGVKVIVILGASFPVMVDSARRLIGDVRMPPAKAARTPRPAIAWRLEAAR